MASAKSAPTPAHVQPTGWQVDQHALTQGLSDAERRKLDAYKADADRLWQQTDALAALQPIIPDSALTRDLDTIIRRLHAVGDTLVVIGTGGASLGAQALCAFAEKPGRVLFLENCDAYSVQQIFARCDLNRTAWAIISKSGETVETLAASLAVMAQYQQAGVTLKDRVITVTSPGARPLRTLAEAQGWSLYDHPPLLGGRFSVFSCVGLLPAAFAGLDTAAIISAVQTAWDSALPKRDDAIFTASSIFAASLGVHSLHVMMGYSDRLRPYTQWYKQLWAESLGKGGHGPTPITATGAIDQHSQLQLYLDGARDKIFTLILPAGRHTPVPLAKVDIAGISYLSAHGMEDIMEASAEATAATLKSKDLPVRVFSAPLNATHVSQLMVRVIVETLLVAAMLGIDPYDQPAVEEGKQRARRSLGLA